MLFMKRPVWIAVVLVLVVLLATAYLWLFGITKRSHNSGKVTRIQYFDNPAVLVVHVESPPGVFVVPSMSDAHAAQFRTFLDPAGIDLESIRINAGSTHDQWSNHTDRHDSLQIGVHGIARGSTRPTYDNRVAIGSTEEFPYQTLRWVTPEKFSRNKPTGTPLADAKVYGEFGFSRYYHIGFRKKPFIIP